MAANQVRQHLEICPARLLCFDLSRTLFIRPSLATDWSLMTLSSKSELFRLSAGVLLAVTVAIFTASPTAGQPSFTNGVLPNGVPDGASGTGVIEAAPLFNDPAAGDYRPDKPAGSPLVDLGGNDSPRDGRLLNGQTQTGEDWDAGALESNGSALPVELTSLEATVDGSAVRLTWSTASETRNAGFRVQRRVEEASAPGTQYPETSTGEWRTLGRVNGAGTTSETQRYRFTDSDLPFNAETLRYRVVQVDQDGTTTPSDPVVVKRTTPNRARLHPPSPNPARTEVTVRVALPEEIESEAPRLQVFDVLGRQVTSYRLKARSGRRQSIRLNVNDWPSGLYLVRLQVGPTTRTERLTVVH